MVALGTTFSAFWIMVNNSWMQVPVGYALENGMYVPLFVLPLMLVYTLVNHRAFRGKVRPAAEHY